MIQQLLSMFGASGGAPAVQAPPKTAKPATSEAKNADHPKEAKDAAKAEAKANPLEQFKDNPAKLLASLNDQKMKDAITAFIDGKEENEKLVSEMITAAKAKLKETTESLLKVEAPKAGAKKEAEAKSEVPDIKSEVKTDEKPKAEAEAPAGGVDPMQILQQALMAAGK